MSDYYAVGKSVPRVDAVDKVTGEAVYTADVNLPGILYAMAKRSPHLHARILRIDTRRAEALPGVKAVITAKDVPDILLGLKLRDVPILARDRVRFAGEKVAAVAAVDEDTALEALGLIDVEYEELPGEPSHLFGTSRPGKKYQYLSPRDVLQGRYCLGFCPSRIGFRA
ncbi:MAG: hypothetical protein HYY81_05260 [Deltaproteobacteria bacterium]|nr:hypothetical protein [Deltaproteobacteria bacterium]